ncbi:hypothetical protein DFP97_107101 [Paenibacillus prosopidis]|uniref:Uncharacterized protein n=1 Tax=Paenibacillus prosopidis TaxID=630520 RepID=A0A368VZP6_9BACL|nr:hypothetical protein DFP97_107101 [Paenibacillus prosopidis]
MTTSPEYLTKDSPPIELEPKENAIVNLSLDKVPIHPPKRNKCFHKKKKCSYRGLVPVTVIFCLTQRKKTKVVKYRVQAILKRSLRYGKPIELLSNHTKWSKRLKRKCGKEKGTVRTTGSMMIKTRSHAVIKQRFHWTM